MFINRLVITTLSTLFTVSLMTACAINPTATEEAANANYGEYPTSYREIIKSYTEPHLKDPDSAKYNFINIPKPDRYKFISTQYGYGVCVNINAKNSYGGYTGNKLHYFLINNDKIVVAKIPEDSFDQAIIGSFCQKLQ